MGATKALGALVMARLRISIRLNPGGTGVPLRKLALISNELSSFLEAATVDLKLKAQSDDRPIWIASNFTNESVGFVNENSGIFEGKDAELFSSEIEHLIDADPRKDEIIWRLKTPTIQHFAKIGESLDSDEILKVGIFNGDGSEQWKDYTKRRSEDLAQSRAQRIQYIGEVFGELHAWYRASDYITVRDLSTNELIRCNYNPQDHEKVYRLWQDRTARIHIGGLVFANLVTRRIESVNADHFQAVTPTTDEEFADAARELAKVYSERSSDEFDSLTRDDE